MAAPPVQRVVEPRPHEGGVDLRLLLTSAGIKNPSISNALVDLLGKPICQVQRPLHSHGDYPFPGGPGMAWRSIRGKTRQPPVRIGLEVAGSAGTDRAAQHR